MNLFSCIDSFVNYTAACLIDERNWAQCLNVGLFRLLGAIEVKKSILKNQADKVSVIRLA